MVTEAERAKTKLQNKMTLLVVSIQIMTAVAVLVTVAYIYQFTMLTSSGEALERSLQMAALKIDAGQIIKYDTTGEKDSEYQELYHYLSDIRTLDEMNTILIMTDAGEKYKYIIEGGWKREQNTTQKGLGSVDDKGVYRPEVQAAFDGSALHTQVYQSQSDQELISAVAPIKDSRGRVIAVLYADILKENVISDGLANLNAIMPYVIGVLAAVCLLVALFSGLYIHHTITVPIRAVSELAQGLSAGQLDKKIPDDILRRTDELGVLSRSYVGMAQSIQTLTEELDVLIASALNEDFEKRADCEKFEGGYKRITQNLNELIKLIVNKIIFYETLLDAVSSPVAAINKEKKISYINKAGAKIVQKGRTEAVGTACSGLGTPYCDTKDCVICRMEEEGVDFVKAPNFKTNGRSYKLSASKMYDKDGEVVGYLETAEDITSEVHLEEYQQAEIENISEGLAHLADGDLSIVLAEIDIGDAIDDVYTRNVQKSFSIIKENINKAVLSFRTYIMDISEKLTAMAYGNIDQEVTLEYRGDFAQVKDSLNVIITRFNEVINEIDSSAEQVRIASANVLEGGQTLAQTTSEQVAASDEISNTVDIVAGKARENASNARKANNFVDNAKAFSKEGAEKMQEMIQAINEINQASSDISRIIKTIDDIAFQTNILALNAAVEAAHAGQFGKGFSVVATEVRTLAAKSAKAARDTADLIESTVKKTAKGVAIAGKAEEAFEHILVSITEAADVVSGISEATNEQAVSIAQISQGLEQIASTAMNNSATAQQSAAASEEMHTQSDSLKAMIKLFKLKKMEKKSSSQENEGPKAEQIAESRNSLLLENNDEKFSDDKFQFKDTDYKKF